MRDAQVVEQPLGLFQILGEIADGYVCKAPDRTRNMITNLVIIN